MLAGTLSYIVVSTRLRPLRAPFYIQETELLTIFSSQTYLSLLLDLKVSEGFFPTARLLTRLLRYMDSARTLTFSPVGNSTI